MKQAMRLLEARAAKEKQDIEEKEKTYEEEMKIPTGAIAAASSSKLFGGLSTKSKRR